MSGNESYSEFAWLQGGPHLEVGFLTELQVPHEAFLSNFLAILGQTTPKVEIVSSSAEIDESKVFFLSVYPWDSEDENSFVVHSWDARARFTFAAKRESLIKITQISDVVLQVNFYFWGDVDDGWGHQGLKNNELPEFVLFLKSLARLSKFHIGSIGFNARTMFLFSTEEDWGHTDYALKNLTRKGIESRANDFIYVIARKDFLDDGHNLSEEHGYFILKMDDIFSQKKLGFDQE